MSHRRTVAHILIAGLATCSAAADDRPEGRLHDLSDAGRPHPPLVVPAIAPLPVEAAHAAPEAASASSTLADGVGFPLRYSGGPPLPDFFNEFYYFDNNPAGPQQRADYMCGTHTYDTAGGYDHSGTDLMLSPFWWEQFEAREVQVVAALAGEVIIVDDGNLDTECGQQVGGGAINNLVGIRHDDGSTALYAHLAIGASDIVQIGQRVEQGDLIGYVGSSGVSQLPHLHFELRQPANGAPVDIYGGPFFDPFAGMCGSAQSVWQHQWAYRQTRISRVSTHSQAPAFASSSCERTQWFHEEAFQPGDSVVVGLGLSHFGPGDSGSIEVFAPDGTLAQNYPIPADPNLTSDLRNAFWTEMFDIPASGETGSWRIRAMLNGRVSEGAFSVGANLEPTIVRSAVLPSSRSVQAGSGVATAFLTLVNPGNVTAEDCWIGPALPIDGAFHYQTTESATNAVTGSVDTPVDIAPGAAQSFVISFAPASGSRARGYELPFMAGCANADSAPVVSGVNTLLLSFEAALRPDIIAISATPSGDGQLRIPGAGAAAAFAVATANVGAAGMMVVSPRATYDGNAPALEICRTDAQGACATPRAASVQQFYGLNETYSYAVFARSSGEIASAPASRRIVVEIADLAGVIRGSTSVSVRTD